MCLLFCADVSIDGDNPDHISWIYERALERADEFHKVQTVFQTYCTLLM